MWVKHHQRIITGLFLVLFSYYAAAQQFPLLHRSYAPLFGSKIWSTYVDSGNTLWVGTNNGMYKYDGLTVKHFTVTDGLDDNEVLGFFAEEHGRIWIWTFTNRLCFIDTRTDRIYNSRQFRGLNLHVPFVVWGLTCAGSELFAVAERQRIVRINTQTLTVDTLPSVELPKIAFRDEQSREILMLCKSPAAGNPLIISRLENGHWIQTGSFPLSISFRNGFYALGADTVFKLSHNAVIKYKVLPHDDTRQGLTKIYLFPGNQYLAVYPYSGFMSVEGDKCYKYRYEGFSDVSKDRQGNLWVSTAKEGLLMVPWYHRQVHTEQAAKGTHFSSMIITAKRHMVYCDTLSFHPYDTAHPHYKLQFAQHSGSGDWLFLYDYNSREARTNARIVLKDSVTKRTIADTLLKVTTIKDVCGSGDEFYIRITRGLLRITYQQHHFRLQELLHERCMAICTNPGGGVWFATLNGLNSYRDGIYRHYPLPSFNAIKLLSAVGRDILVNSGDNQLFLFDTASCKYRQLPVPGNEQAYPVHIFDIDSHRKFLITNEHVYLMEYAAFPYRFTPAECPDVNPHDIINMQCHNDTAYILTEERFYSCPLHIITGAAAPPDPEVVRVEYDAENMPGRKIVAMRADGVPVKLAADARNISLYINAHAIAFKNIQVQYALENTDRQAHRWEPLRQGCIDISLPHYGKMYVYLRVSNASSGWGKPKKYVLDIAWPLWYDYRIIIPAAIMIFTLLAYLVFILFRRYILRKEQQQLQAITATHNEFKALNAMMNPHFVFNSLNSIQSFINTGDKNAANQYLQVFSKLIRQNMSNMSTQYIPLQHELDIIGNYIEIEKLRFAGTLDFDIINKDEDTLYCYIPPLMIQPLVENAIVHGLLPLRNTIKRITIQVCYTGNKLIIEVTDNGIGYYNSTRKMHNKPSLGIEYINKRLNHIKAVTGTGNMEIISVPGEAGTTVRLILPRDLDAAIL
ncbi:histidine kinase [Chitinophagaceae bacterium MMS25-I14]